MRVLVSGGAGYIGSHIAVVLLQAGHKVIIYDNYSNSHPTSIPNIEKISGSKVEVVNGDVTNVDDLMAALREFQVDTVIHLAGLKSVGNSIQDPLNYYHNNIVGTINLLSAMERYAVKRLIFSSSATVYGDPKYLPIDELHSTAPKNPYGCTKLYAEKILSDLAENSLGWSIINLRYFNPIGAHESLLIGENSKGTPENLVPYLARVASGQLDKLNIFGSDYPTPDGTGIRDYIHVMDLAEGHLAALNYLNSKSGSTIFNLGTGKGYSVLEMLREFERVSGNFIPYNFISRRAGDISECYASCDLANSVLGWRAKRGLDEMCQSAWGWERYRLNY
jgi:UDP-glucose 4-epimerase